MLKHCIRHRLEHRVLASWSDRSGETPNQRFLLYPGPLLRQNSFFPSKSFFHNQAILRTRLQKGQAHNFHASEWQPGISSYRNTEWKWNHCLCLSGLLYRFGSEENCWCQSNHTIRLENQGLPLFSFLFSSEFLLLPKEVSMLYHE